MIVMMSVLQTLVIFLFASLPSARVVRTGLELPVEDGFTQRRSEVVPNWSSSPPVEIRLS